MTAPGKQPLDTISEALETLRQHAAGSAQASAALEDLKRASQTLAAQARRYQSLFELVPEGYLVTDAEGVIQEASQAAGAARGGGAVVVCAARRPGPIGGRNRGYEISNKAVRNIPSQRRPFLRP